MQFSRNLRMAAAGLLLPALAISLALAADAGAETVSFGFTGSEQAFVVPAGVSSILATATGAPGGGPGGGAAGSASGTIGVSPGQTLYIEVGGSTIGAHGGFNGGGAGGSDAYGGGGASDVRTQPTAMGLSSLASRLIVAAGGGGSGATTEEGAGGGGGAGGGLSGGSGEMGQGPNPVFCLGGGGGTQEGGGLGRSFGGSEEGEAGRGGAGGPNGGGGGGGGFYGGGGGENPNDTLGCAGAGGGGGSSKAPSVGATQKASPGQPAAVTFTFTPTSSPAPASPPSRQSDNHAEKPAKKCKKGLVRKRGHCVHKHKKKGHHRH